MSATVATVFGPVPSEQLGVTLMHEHLLLDASHWWHPAEEGDTEGKAISHSPFTAGYLHRLRHDPFLSLDNTQLDDEHVAAEELARVRAAGGRTVIDPTCRGIGRDPAALRRIAERAGVQVVMGAGYYLEAAHPAAVRGMSVADVAAEIERDVLEGVDANGVRAGIIGEIGVSKDFTAAEEKVLRGAARAQARTGVPLAVHLPGWERLGGRVLDLVAAEGGILEATVLCHMNPSLGDLAYQIGLAERGAWLEYDMLGMDYFFADQRAQSPCDEENARAIRALAGTGHAGRLLLSGDVFLKMMLVRNGGFGYAHVLANFVPRLRRHGLGAEVIDQLLVTNPRMLFELAATRGGAQ
jgi:phosphotriesterase-related protein